MAREHCDYCGADLGCEFNSARALEYWVLRFHGWAACDTCLLAESEEFEELGADRLVALRLSLVHGIDLTKIDARIAQVKEYRTPRDMEILQDRRAAIFELHAADELVASMFAGRELASLTAHLRDAHAMLPSYTLGKKMRAGRKPGTPGPVRLAIRRYLKKNPAAKNQEIWAALQAKPPRGWTFMENRLGRYIEPPSGTQGMEYRRFLNVCSEERKSLKQ